MRLLQQLIRFLAWLVGLGVIALAVLVILVARIDPNEHKDWLETRFYKETGQALSLDGPITLTYYPWLGVEAADVSIADSEEFGGGSFADLDYLKLRVKSLPLLREEYEVDTVVVKGAVINLMRNEQGVANWDASAGAPADAEDKPALPLAALALGGVSIEDARITLDDRHAAVRYEFSRINVSTAELKYGEPVDINLGFHASSDKPELDARVSLAGVITYATDAQQFGIAPLAVQAALNSSNIPGGETALSLSTEVDVNLDENTVTLSDFTLEALDSRVAGNLSARHIDSPTPTIAATLDAQGKDLAPLFKLAEIEPLASQLARLADRSFRINTTLDADLEQGNIDLSELTARVLGADLSGTVQARNIHSSTPAYRGDVRASGPDLPTLLQVLGQLQGGEDAALSEYGRTLAGVPARSFRLETVFDADLERGNVSVPTLSLEALGITVAGTLEAAHMHSSRGEVEGDLNIRGERMAGLLVALDQADLAATLQSVQLDTRIRGKRSGISLEPMSLNAVFAGPDIPGSPATLSLNADTRLNLDEETLTFDGFTLQGLGLETGGRVAFSNLFGELAAAGQLEVAPFNLRRLARQLGQELPASADDSVFGDVALSGSFDLSAAGLRLEQVQVQLDDTRLDGEFSMTEATSGPITQFALNLDRIDLDRYLPPAAEQNPSSARANGAAEEEMRLPIALLLATDLDGRLSINTLDVSGLHLDDVGVRLQTRDGVLQLDEMTASLYEGVLSASGALDARANPATLALNTELLSIHVEPLLLDMTGEARLRGEGNFSATLNASGNSVAAMKRSLSGPMSISLRDGAIVGFNLGRALRLWSQFKTGRTLELEEAETTDFTRFSGNPVATAGVIRMDDLILEAPAFRLQGAGVLADLHSGNIDYRGLATVVDTARYTGGEELAALEGLSLPVEVIGTLDDPRIRLAWEKILAGLLVNKVLDVLDLKLPGARAPEDSGNETGTGEEEQPDPLEELLKEGLKKGLKGIFGKD